jgi:hypothetical protein
MTPTLGTTTPPDPPPLIPCTYPIPPMTVVRQVKTRYPSDRLFIPNLLVVMDHAQLSSLYIPSFDPKSKRHVPGIMPYNVMKVPAKEATEVLKEFKKILKDPVIVPSIIPSQLAVQIGADPEIFVRNERGEPIPAWKFLPKAPPKPTEPLSYFTVGDRGYRAQYWDGVQAEWRARVVECHEYLTDEIHEGMKAVYYAALKINPRAKLSIHPVEFIPQEVMEDALPEHIALGCAPSKNVYGLRPEPVGDARALPWRCAGYHIHYGFNGSRDKSLFKFTSRQFAQAVRMLDATVGLISVSMGEGLDDDLQRLRRTLYGLPGEYRLTSYGFEYRTLSTAPILCHPATYNIHMDIARVAMKLAMRGMSFVWKAHIPDVIEAIQSCNAELARKILRKNETMLRGILKATYNDTDLIDAAYTTIHRPISETVKDPWDVESNWRINTYWDTLAASSHCKWASAGAYVRSGHKL